MQRTFSDLEYAAKKKVTRRERFLNELEAIAPWAALCAEIEPYYPRGEGRGRPPIGLERMLRMYLAQHCFGLSDEATEDALYDSQAIRRFVGIDLAREIFLAAGASVEVFAKDGDSLAARVPFLCARGSAQALHAAYKTAQCVMEYAGGIAERTRAMVDAARSVNPQAVVAGTRKHYPGGKRIALAGLLAGGGTVHRLGRSEERR